MKRYYIKHDVDGLYEVEHKTGGWVKHEDALKIREQTIEECANVAESHTSTEGACPESISNVIGYRTAVSQITEAIRTLNK